MKFLSAKFGFTSPPEKGPQNEEKLQKILKMGTFSGGGERNFN